MKITLKQIGKSLALATGYMMIWLGASALMAVICFSLDYDYSMGTDASIGGGGAGAGLAPFMLSAMLILCWSFIWFIGMLIIQQKAIKSKNYVRSTACGIAMVITTLFIFLPMLGLTLF